MSRSGSNDVSKPKVEKYEYKKDFYRSTEVAAEYDQRRFVTRKRKRRNLRKWRAIQKALADTTDVRSILDLPCGTGRFTGDLARQGYHVVGSDISFEMMRQAAVSPEVRHEGIAGYVNSDAEGLPFRNASLDCIVSIRFMFHVDPTTRRRILREMGRVSRRWLIIDYRHRYTARWVLRQLRYALGLMDQKTERVSWRGMHSEFHDAGLKILRVIPVHSWWSDKWIVLAEAPHDEPALDPGLAEERLEGSDLEGARISGVLGEGRRSTVYRASWQGRDIALKVYKNTAIESHARKNPQPIAEFEYSRNHQFYSVPGLERYVAQPFGFAVTPHVQAIAQEPIDGPLYYFFQKQNSGSVPASFADHLREILRLSHQAELYDVDLHAMNVLVSRDSNGEPVPKLFDFNLIPFTLRPQNPLVGLLLKTGLMSKTSRDLRRLRRFHNYRHIENRLLKFYKTSA